jgi:hypothetical protein
MFEALDHDELKQQAEDVLGLLDSLRPHPNAKPISRHKLKMMAALSGIPALIEVANDATTFTLFWELDGEIIAQELAVQEIPIG